MLREIELEVIHDIHEKVELIFKGKRHRFKRDRREGISKFVLKTENEIETVCIRQYHPLNSLSWLRCIILPIAFLQGYLLRYERKYIDDYFSQIEFDVKSAGNCSVKLKLDKYDTGQFADKSFYVNIRKDQYLMGKEKVYYYHFLIVQSSNCLVENVLSNKNVTRAFRIKWCIARITPALATYGSVAIAVQLYLYSHFKKSGFDHTSLLALILLGIIYSMLFLIIKKVLSFKVRDTGMPWNEEAVG